MRGFIRICLILGVVWCLWWLLASSVLRIGVERWLDAQASEGWQAELRATEGGGFPLTLTAALRDLAMADPVTGLAVSGDPVVLEADAWWPGHVRVILPQTPLTFATPEGRGDLVMDTGLMRLDLAPRAGLDLRRLAWTSAVWQVAGPEGVLFGASNLALSMVQDETPERYRFQAVAADLTPGAALRARLRVPEDWPVAFEATQLDADITFDRPWDLRALEERRPQPREIALRLAEAEWGALLLRFAASLKVDDKGVPEGEMRLQAREWQQMLRVAEASGSLPERLALQAERMLSGLASLSGSPESLDVTLTARDGLIWLGFVPLGPAPRLVLR